MRFKIKKFLPRAVRERRIKTHWEKIYDAHFEAARPQLEELAGQHHEFNQRWLRWRREHDRKNSVDRLREIYVIIKRLARIPGKKKR